MPQSDFASQSEGTRFAPGGPLRGKVDVPGDKSISHRALILSALAVGRSRITGLLMGEDVIATAAALRAMGADIAYDNGVCTVHGVGVGGLMQPATALDMGNSGTSTRLLMGLVASHAIHATFVGDGSLSSRPMGRVIAPIATMGADVTARETLDGKRCLPLTVRGLNPAVPTSYRLPVASAQVKSAILLAALNIPGVTRVIEPVPTRDHSETMLAAFGAKIEISGNDAGERVIALEGEAELAPTDIDVPGDPSSAAFPIVAALLVPGSDVTVRNVGVNPTRAGLFEALRQMGARLEFQRERTVGGEPVADIRAQHSDLVGVEVPADITPSMIDEFPILFVAAALAKGRTTTRGLEELRVKESDRLALMAEGLGKLGATVTETPDGLCIEGTGSAALVPPDGEQPVIRTALDHRIAMSLAVAGHVTEGGLTVDDMAPTRTSFPAFAELLTGLRGGTGA